ncbi:hypothetical protein HDU93_008078 [Gonapodya sp. JEL0774]|nr:hypothetical protein HDU93_008078 [Gonapodya sp. JEL0774]
MAAPRRRLSKMSQSIEGRVAIVTGGASGIGRACAHVLADAGAKVAVVDIGSERVDKAVAEIREVHGEANVKGWVCDVKDGERVKAVVEEVAAHFGQIDILINSAGVGAITGPYNIHSDDETFFKNYDGTLDINLNGTMRFIKACTPHLISSAAASLTAGSDHATNLTTTSRIINISSSAGLYTTASLGYDTSKHGVLGITKAACAQLGPKGITVNALCPGLVRTPLTSMADDMFVALGTQVPSGRAAEPEDVAQLAYVLCLPALTYVNGQSVVVDGGWCNMLNGWPYAHLAMMRGVAPALFLAATLVVSLVRAQAPTDCVAILAVDLIQRPMDTSTSYSTMKGCDGEFALMIYSLKSQNFVECEGGRITTIQFINFNFTSLSYFANLTAVTFLNVRNNLIAEPLPSWLSTWTNLNKLVLDNNRMTGTTEVLGTLPKLSYVSLSNNGFTGNPAWLSTSTQLSTIYLDVNQFSGTFPDISQLRNLSYIDVGQNGFTGPVPSTTNFPALVAYSMYSNGFTGAIPSLSSNPLLISFNVNNNSMTGSLPDPGGCPKLTYYGAQRNSGVTGSIPPGLFTLSNLKTIALSRDSLSGPLPSGLGDMTQLVTLWLDGNTGLNGPIPDLSKLTKLTSLDLSNTSLSGGILLASNVGGDFCSLANTNLCLVGGSISTIPSSCRTGGGLSLPACAATTASSGTSTAKVESTSVTSAKTSSSSATATAAASGSEGPAGGTPNSGGGSSTGAIVGGVVGGIAALGIIAGLAWYFGRRRGASKDTPSGASTSAPLNPTYPPPNGQTQYYAPQYNNPVPQMAPVSYPNSPYSQGSLGSSIPPQGSSSQNSGSLYSTGQYGSGARLLAPPGSLGTVGSSTSSGSTKVNEVYVVAQPFFASQQDEMTCQQGQKVFVSDVFADDWCKALNLETMQSGIVPMTVLAPANQPSIVQSRMMSGSLYQPNARGQSVGAGSTIVTGEQALASLRNYLDMGIINSQQYMTGSRVLGNSSFAMGHGDVKGPGAPVGQY